MLRRAKHRRSLSPGRSECAINAWSASRTSTLRQLIDRALGFSQLLMRRSRTRMVRLPCVRWRGAELSAAIRQDSFLTGPAVSYGFDPCGGDEITASHPVLAPG
ncbi:hypothetical protein GCM10008023_39190 [Sphingomonas glacialis]|uniref:Uncharacterized protein n=1 Tax=Sphingomonas glacialis TaxID=658225 RepID=A0ABQ3LW20_9SPHN|nr:hypothetical protein GCM10008023_39190 [Sphingomonas glacialis]